MKLFDRFIRAIERNSRSQERRKLSRELDGIFALGNKGNHHRAARIIARIMVLNRADLDATLNRNRPVVSVSEQVKRQGFVQVVEDDATPAHHWHGYGKSKA